MQNRSAAPISGAENPSTQTATMGAVRRTPRVVRIRDDQPDRRQLSPLAVLFLARRVLPADAPFDGRRRYDLPGAATVTAAMLLLVYTVTQAPQVGWGAARACPRQSRHCQRRPPCWRP